METGGNTTAGRAAPTEFFAPGGILPTKDGLRGRSATPFMRIGALRLRSTLRSEGSKVL